jgi:nucleoside 2-deoxyribosyltransferase
VRRIYLAGPINGCTDEEANGWRDQVRAALTGWDILDPMSRDYRGREGENAAAIVVGDKEDISASDVVLVNATRPTWGTAMELHHAYTRRKRIVAFGTTVPSPWLVYHCDSIHPTLAGALAELAR